MDESLVGKKLGNFEIKGLLGFGGMAKVYRAYQPSMQRDVAIKVMNHEFSDDEDFVKRFEREAEIFAELQHPHILPVIDFGRSDDGLLYIVFRYVEGGSLDRRIQRSEGLPLDVTNKILSQVASALTFAHEKGIIHRDIKSSNVLLDNRDNAYLTDFGIARMLAKQTRLTTTNNIMGTPSYMSPEQWRGEVLDARSDIYSLGVIVYEMLSGDLPYTADTPFTLMYKHVNEPPPSIEHRLDLPAAVEAVIRRAMAKGLDERFQSAEEFAAAFSVALHGEMPSIPTTPPIKIEITSESHPTGTLESTTPTGTLNTTLTHLEKVRMPLIMVAVVGLTLLSVAVGALLFGNKDNNNPPPSATNSPSAIIAQDSVYILVHDRADIYDGPGLHYPTNGQMLPNERYTVIGISIDRRWVQIEQSDARKGSWIRVMDVEVTGDTSQLPVIGQPQPDQSQSQSNSTINIGPMTRGDFSELGLAFNYPAAWLAEMVEAHLELQPPRGPIIQDTRIQLFRGSRQALNDELRLQLETVDLTSGNLMPRLTESIIGTSPLVGFQVIQFPITSRYILISNSFEVNGRRHYLILIEYQNDDYVLGWGQFSIATISEADLQSLVLVPIISSMTIDGNPVVAGPGVSALPPNSPSASSNQPITHLIGG